MTTMSTGAPRRTSAAKGKPSKAVPLDCCPRCGSRSVVDANREQWQAYEEKAGGTFAPPRVCRKCDHYWEQPAKLSNVLARSIWWLIGFVVCGGGLIVLGALAFIQPAIF